MTDTELPLCELRYRDFNIGDRVVGPQGKGTIAGLELKVEDYPPRIRNRVWAAPLWITIAWNNGEQTCAMWIDHDSVCLTGERVIVCMD